MPIALVAHVVPAAPALSGEASSFGDFVHLSAQGTERMAQVVEKAHDEAHVFEPGKPGERR